MVEAQGEALTPPGLVIGAQLLIDVPGEVPRSMVASNTMVTEPYAGTVMPVTVSGCPEKSHVAPAGGEHDTTVKSLSMVSEIETPLALLAQQLDLGYHALLHQWRRNCDLLLDQLIALAQPRHARLQLDQFALALRQLLPQDLVPDLQVFLARVVERNLVLDPQCIRCW